MAKPKKIVCTAAQKLAYSDYAEIHNDSVAARIHVAEGAKIDQNGLKMGSKHLFVHPQWSRITLGRTRF